ncbi:MAG: glutamate--tRNA ligase [Bacteroidales bacterium]|nr:glutamate--tRNA ligase [Bacteroidales bacterium]
MDYGKVRVRFAPSPTGPLHIGGLRTALFNYLFAKKNNGDFILRIEDTDLARYVPGAEEYIIESLKWCNIKIDEGITVGGLYEPYRQSERKGIYRKYAKQLIDNGYAYYAFDTPDDLEQMRGSLKAEKSSTQQYNAITRSSMKNSLSLTNEEVRHRLESVEPYVIRFKMPWNEEVTVNDLIRGKVTVNTSELDDKVLFKSDGMPTYHLANVVDDHLMKITHVIRGEEWLPSTPLHVLLYKAFGWENKMPEFAHMPLTLKPDGKGKLSKRDGDRLGFPVFPLQWTNPITKEVFSGFRESGYFPEAFINILAFLGWNPGTEQEIFSMDELTKVFSLERIVKSGSRFDPEKAKWYNHQYLIKKSDDELAELYKSILKEKGIDADLNYLKKICALIKERVNFVSEFWDQSYYFFEAPTEYDQKVIKKRWKENTPDILKDIIDILKKSEPFNAVNTEKLVKDYIQKNELNMGQVLNVLRLTLVGSAKGPGLFNIMELLGKKEVIRRIEAGLIKIKLQ